MKAEDIFLAALEKTTPAERQTFLDGACEGDADLRSQVAGLLHSHEAAGSFLNAPLFDSTATTDGAAYVSELPAAAGDEFSLDFLAPATIPGGLGRIGPYEVTERIGRGGMGLVLKALDGKLNRVVAIKVLAPELAVSPTARKRFQREAHAAAAVVHQHVVTIHAVEEDRLPYLVMEYIDGQSLQQKIDREGHLELREILRIGQQVAAGLAAAHAHGLMHRDVKPANILLENGVERVRITDFGLARAVDDVGMTKTGDVAGTPQYMSPEQAQGLPMDARSDLFSLGCVLYAMCTGRSPFRAETTLATVRRVCEDTPRPIREVNPEIPQWLATLIDRLLAKQPAERFQSAAEVAELLGRQLAEVQHPSAVGQAPAPVGNALRGIPSGPRNVAEGIPYRITHRWAIAATVLLCLLVGLGLSEAGGITKLTTSVIRVLTPEGTLIIEVDDPGVTLTVEGDGGLVIKGAGPREVRLPVGKYTVRATKDGQPVKEEIVSIIRDGKQTVRVLREPPPVPPKVPPSALAPFVLLAGTDAAERRFDTLYEAVQRASDGDTIEIRDNGPFISKPVSIHRIALTIRAGEGFRPVIKLRPEAVESELALIATNSSLVLEGLELHRAPPQGNSRVFKVVEINAATLRAANCRFRGVVYAEQWPAVVLRNCEFLAEDGNGGVTGWRLRSGARMIVENCLFRTRAGAVGAMHDDATTVDVSIQIARSTFLASKFEALWFDHRCPLPAVLDGAQPRKPIRVEVSGTVFDSQSILCLHRDKDLLETVGVLKSAEAETTLLRLLQWQGDHNLFATGTTSVNWYDNKKQQPPHGPKSLEEWRGFWRTAEADSLEGRVRFQGGNLLSRTESDLDRLTPDDFRLRPDSPGYRAGPDGKDLGADVDLVGPGAAYERWKQTPEYQEWRKDSGQLNNRAAAKPESGAFVLQSGSGAAERKFDTLAEAVLIASDGDTIEIRGNGPFLSPPVRIHRIALTVRAGEGFRPVIKLSPEAVPHEARLLTATAALVLEGLELHREPSQKPGKSQATVYITEAPLWAVNCRFRGHVWANYSPVCAFRNCQFYGVVSSFGGLHRRGARVSFDNCLFRAKTNAMGLHFDGAALGDVSIQIQRSTLVSGVNSFWLPLQNPLSLPSDRPQTSDPIRLEVSGCTFDAPSLLAFAQTQESLGKAAVREPAEAEAALLRLLQWRGERNLFSNSAFVDWWADGKHQPPHGPSSLDEWKRFWGAAEGGSLESHARFQGGNLASSLDADLDQLTPDDFRLRADSPGYRAGPDGKDLGADVDLVGPGAAYERWKQTPEYQEWLKDSGQLKDGAAAKPETGAFVLQGGAGVAERKFDTLADAVQRASDGDTIEIRGNGPFVTGGVTIGQRLVIRAGQRYSPTITLSQVAADMNVPLLTTSAPLVLEGLELRRMGGAEGPVEGRYPILVKPWKGELHVSNCRFVLNTSLGNWSGVIAAGSSVCTVRNCQFIGTDATAALAWNCPPGGRGTMENCVSCACDLMSVDVRSSDVADVSIQIRRNTTVGDCLVLGFDEARKPAGEAPIRLDFSENLTSCTVNEDYAILRFDQRNLEPPLAARDAEEVLRALVALHEQHNVYAAGARMLHHGKSSQDGFSFLAASQAKGLVDWNRFWTQTDTGSREGAVRFHGGDILQRTLTNPQSLTPQDFRLREDSTGYRAGNDGQDLGADVDLVGPGGAYERWKQTPEYQQWLKDTKQVTRAASARPESDAAAKELAKWQGEWENAEYGRLVIHGERWSSYPKNGFEVVSTIKIVEVADEMTHLLLLNAGIDGKVRTIQTILRVDGDTLHNCGTIGSVRPTEFANRPGFIYTQWKRVSKPPP